MFCDINDVTKELGSSTSSNWTNDDITSAIIDSTEIIKGELLAGAVSQTNVTLWEGGDDIPTGLKLICAMKAAVMILDRKGMKEDKAKRLDSKADKSLKSLLGDKKSVLFDSDNEVISTAADPVRSSTDGCTPKLSMGDSGLGTIGTLDAMDD